MDREMERVIKRNVLAWSGFIDQASRERCTMEALIECQPATTVQSSLVDILKLPDTVVFTIRQTVLVK